MQILRGQEANGFDGFGAERGARMSSSVTSAGGRLRRRRFRLRFCRRRGDRWAGEEVVGVGGDGELPGGRCRGGGRRRRREGRAARTAITALRRGKSRTAVAPARVESAHLVPPRFGDWRLALRWLGSCACALVAAFGDAADLAVLFDAGLPLAHWRFCAPLPGRADFCGADVRRARVRGRRAVAGSSRLAQDGFGTGEVEAAVFAGVVDVADAVGVGGDLAARRCGR